jgi:glycosyltransferase involved in cell wall biosynthesis
MRVLPKCDYLIVELPPPFLALTGWLLSKLKGARLILNVADLWLDWAVEMGIISRGVAWRFTRSLERTMYRSAWLVTGQSMEILEAVKMLQPSSTTYHLSNGVDVDFSVRTNCDPKVRLELSRGKDLVALYAGVHGRAQGLNQILMVADLVRDIRGLQIAFVGDGTEREELMRQTHQMNLENVQFLGPRLRSEMPAILGSADIALVPLAGRLYGAVPSKLYEAMGASLPILLMAEGEAAEIVRTADAGLVVQPGDIKGMADSLTRLVNDKDLRDRLGRNGRHAAITRYNRAVIAEEFMRSTALMSR